MFDDVEWQRLAEAMGQPAWAASLLYATQLARKENERELDRLLSEWTRTLRSQDLMVHLQKAGVHAGKINNMANLFSDPQLAYRRFWRAVDQKEVGVHHAEMPAFELSETPCADPSPDPCLSEHTEMVLKKLLGLSKEEIESLAGHGAIEKE